MTKNINQNVNVSFSNNQDWLFVKTPSEMKRRLCPYVKVRAKGRFEGEPNYHVVISYLNGDGHRKRFVQQQRDLLKPSIIIEHLADLDFDLPKSAEDRKLLARYISEAKPKARVQFTRRTGWHKQAFVTKKGVLGNPEKGIIGCHAKNSQGGDFKTRGALDDWQNNVAQLASSSTRLVFAVGAAFAAPMLKLGGVESGGFHLVGDSSKGKSTTLLVANSVWGRAVREQLINWDTTDTALEEIAESHCDILMCLDEFSRLANTPLEAAKRARKIAFMIASGQGKQRSSRYKSQTYTHAEWRTLMLSTGEIGLSDTSAAAGLDRLGGEEVRFIDLPAEVDADLGIFEALPEGCNSSAALALLLENGCKKAYGVAGTTFLIRVLDDYKGTSRQLKKYMKEFMSNFDISPDRGWDHRFGRRFALVYASLMLARDFKVIAWEANDILLSVRACYLDAKTASQKTARSVDNVLKKLRSRLNSGKGVVDLRSSMPDELKDIKGVLAYRLCRNKEEFFAIRTEGLNKLAGGKLEGLLLLRTLQSAGLLLVHTSATKFSKPVGITGLGRSRYYCVLKAILDN